MFAEIKDGVVARYPFTVTDLRRENPSTSFPPEPSLETLAEWDVYPVVVEPEPAVPFGKRLERAEPVHQGGAWVQGWVIQDEAPEFFEDWRRSMVVSPLQFRRALRQTGLYQSVTDYVATQDDDTQDAWEYAVEIRRSDALIAQAAALLGKTAEEVDDLFRLAATL